MRVLTLSAMAAVFLLDILTPADNVSICFIYAAVITGSLLEERRLSFHYATLGTALSVAGSVIQPPTDAVEASFVANRVIAVITQWLVAGLVWSQQQRRDMLEAWIREERDKTEVRHRFLDILSHEIGTALTTIAGQSYRLTKLSGTLTPEDIESRSAKIGAAAERIREVVERVRFASTLGTLPLRRGPIDLRDIVARLIRESEEDGVDAIITADLDGLPSAIEGDPVLLRNAIENVLVNCRRHGGSHPHIAVRGTTVGRFAWISVTDDGPGIDPGDIDRIGSPYFRGRNSAGRGTGLGLFVVGQIVRSHGGDLSVTSEPGRGTRVTISLPILAEPPADADRTAEGALPPPTRTDPPLEAHLGPRDHTLH